MTRVKFVIFKNELVALFPDQKERDEYIASYSLRDGHKLAHFDLMRRHRATESEYTPLLNALIAKGYADLKVINQKPLKPRYIKK